jgi:hypothetical protein
LTLKIKERGFFEASVAILPKSQLHIPEQLKLNGVTLYLKF